VVLGLLSAVAWGSGDFGGGMLSRRAPLFGVVAGSQAIGMVAAVVLAIARGEPLPQGPDLAWAVLGGLAGVLGITALYRGLAVGRMGVVAPTTGVLAAIVPVLVGFATEGMPRTEALVGIAFALVAVVLVTRAPGHGTDRPSGIRWALLSGLAIGTFNVCVGQFSGAGAFGPLAIMRMLQVIVIGVLIFTWHQPWRLDRSVGWRLAGVGLLDMTGNAAFILAAQSGQLAIAAVLSSLYPVVTVVLAIAILRERLTTRHVVGIGLTAAAIALISVGTTTL